MYGRSWLPLLWPFKLDLLGIQPQPWPLSLLSVAVSGRLLQASPNMPTTRRVPRKKDEEPVEQQEPGLSASIARQSPKIIDVDTSSSNIKEVVISTATIILKQFEDIVLSKFLVEFILLMNQVQEDKQDNPLLAM